MAHEQLVLNSVLCFLLNKFGKVDVKSLKAALFDFYDVDTLSSAKLQLMEHVDGLKLTSKRPHVPHRRDGDGRLQKEVDDLLLLSAYLDEQKVLDKLPQYVAASPDSMPSLRLYEGDLSVLMALLHNMNSRISEFGSALAAITSVVHTLQSSGPPELSRASVVNKVSTASNHNPYGSTEQITTVSVAGNSDRNHVDVERAAVTDVHRLSTMDWPTLMSTPICHDNRFAALSTDDDDHQQPQELYTTVVNSRRKRPRQRTPQQQRQQQSATTSQQQQPAPGRRVPTLVGKSKTGSTIAAAKKLREKSVFCVDNVITSCTVDDMCNFVRSLSVEVQSCFETKPRRRRGESVESVTDRKAFRVCIYKDDRQRFLNPAVWPDSISISDWFFKEPTSDDKRRRIHVSNNDRGAAQTANDTDADADSGRRTADVNTVGTDGHATLMDPETDAKAASSSAAAAAAAADAHISTRTDDDTIVVEYNITDGST